MNTLLVVVLALVARGGSSSEPSATSSVVLGPLAWRAGDVIESSRRVSTDLELSALANGSLKQRTTRAREIEETKRVLVVAANGGDLARASFRWAELVEHVFVPESADVSDAASDVHDVLEGRAVDLAIEDGSVVARAEDGGAVPSVLSFAARAREVSSTKDLASGTRALEKWLSGRRFERGVAVEVPDEIARELVRAEEPCDESSMTLAWRGVRADGALELATTWALAWKSEAPSEERLAELSGTIVVRRASARVLAIDVAGPLTLAGAAQQGDDLVELTGSGRMELHEKRTFARAD